MFKELTLQNIWESEMPVENGSTFKFKLTLWWPTLVDELRSPRTWVPKTQVTAYFPRTCIFLFSLHSNQVRIKPPFYIGDIVVYL
jgi:hypothetical protein